MPRTSNPPPASSSNLPVYNIHPGSTTRRAGPKHEILFITSAPEDHHALSAILTDRLWHLAKARTCQEAIARLSRKRIPVVICERDLPDGSWKDVLNYFAEFPDPPVLIVTSESADERLWLEVLNLGGFDVLAKPFRESEVKYVLAAAWRQKDSLVWQAASGTVTKAAS